MNRSEELLIVKQRMCELLTAPARELKAEGRLSRPTWVSSDFIPSPIDGGIRFADVDYECKNRAAWKVAAVLSRALELARYYVVEQRQDEGVMSLLVSLLTDYAFVPYENPNWWHNEIGAPSDLSALLIMIGDELPTEVRTALIKKIGRGAIADHPEIVTDYSGTHTGANLIWFCVISMRHAALTNDEDELDVAVKTIAKETKGDREGLQSDGSFFQHGRRLYSLGYGRSYLASCADAFYYVSSTSFAFPEYACDNLVTHLLEGIRYMIGGEGVDYAATGREYVRNGALRASSLIRPVRILSECTDFPRRDEIKALLDDLLAKRTPNLPVKYFDVAKLLTARVGGVYLSFKGSDPTIVDAEVVNGENALGYNLSYGTHTTFMRSGREYMDVAGLWDFSSIPGTTSRIEPDEVIAAYPFKPVSTDDFGGMSDGDIGVCYLGCEREGVSATVTAFATPVGMVLLGAGISEKDGKALHTTVEQNHFAGAYTVSEDGMDVVHGGILYRNLDSATKFEISHEYVEQDYKRICLLSDSIMKRGDVFKITIPLCGHSSYAYMVSPEELRDKRVEVLVNNAAVQAISIPDGRTIAVFHKDCCIKLPKGGICGSKGDIIVV